MGNCASLEVALLAQAGVKTVVSRSMDPDDWLPNARKADAVLTRHAPIGARELQEMPLCRVISRYGTGYDNIDINAARAAGVVVTAVSDYATVEVAEHTLALILAVTRALGSFRESVQSGGWTPQPLPDIRRLDGRRLGLVGCGRIGAAVASRAAAFGMEVGAFDPLADSLPRIIRRYETLDALLRNTDVLSLHAPLTSETRSLIGEVELDRLPRGAAVVNVSRGGLLDLDAAMARVEEGHLTGLGIDVAEVEPLPATHPARNHPKVVLTPHVGYFSMESVVAAKERSVGEIIRVLSGHAPLNPV